MSVKHEAELLRYVPLFSGIDTKRLTLLAYTSEIRTYEPDEVLFRHGEAGDCAYVVLSGAVEAIVDTPAGEIVVARLADGDLVGEIAILCDVPRTATVKAVAAVKTLRIKREPFFELLNQYPDIALRITRALAERLANTTAQLAAS